MTFGFVLVLAGFILLDAGWKGTTPAGVLKGITAGTHGPGGVLAETGRDVRSAVTGGTSAEETPTSKMPKNLKALKGSEIEKHLAIQHPELKPGIRTVLAVVLHHFPGLVITATTNGEHVSGSYHYKGRAVDIAGSTQYMHEAAAWIAANLTPVLTEGIHNPNLSVKYHHHVSPSYWGSEIWAEHANHIHLAV